MSVGTGTWRRESETQVRPAPEVDRKAYPPFTILTGSETTTTPLEWDWHSHPVHELVWVRGGTLTARVGDMMFTVPEGHGLWVPAGTEHAGRFTARVTFHEAAFAPDATPTAFTQATVVTMSPLLQALMDHLAGELSPQERRHAETVVFDVLRPADCDVTLRLPGDDRVDPIARALLADPADPRSLDEWARLLGLSDRTIARAFRASTGLSFTGWRQVLRIHHALVLLGTGLDVRHTSERLGYANPSTFIAAFRRVLGTSPGRFQNR